MEGGGSQPWWLLSRDEPSGSYPPASSTLAPLVGQAVPSSAQQSSSVRRCWPAVLTLFFLSPIVGEVLSGSTPPWQFINPIALLGLTGLYGSGAVVIRELTRRRGLNWQSLLLFGLAYGILEEGLVVTSWFNPYWPDLRILASYGRLFETSWVWAVQLTLYHAVVSMIIPIVLTELLFPKIADRPWVKARGFVFFTIWLGAVSLIEFLLFAFVMFRARGYMHPPLMYLGAVCLAIGFVIWGLSLRQKKGVSVLSQSAPGLWWLRLSGFAGIALLFLAAWVLPGLKLPPSVPIGVMVGDFILGYWFISRWTKCAGWGASHRLALISGVLFFFILLTPLIEATPPPGKTTTGMTVVGLMFLGFLIFLAWRERRQRTKVHHVPVGEMRVPPR